MCGFSCNSIYAACTAPAAGTRPAPAGIAGAAGMGHTAATTTATASMLLLILAVVMWHQVDWGLGFLS